MHRRDVIKGIGAGLTAPAIISQAAAQSASGFPNKPITLIMPWPAGGGIDIWYRQLAEVAGKILGQSVVVDNRVGGSGTAGPATMAANAKPDGYTISQIPVTVHRFPSMPKTTYDPIKDFTYIIHTSGYTFGVVVRGDSPLKTFKDLIEFARANPGKLTYATPGAGTSLHIGMEQIAQQAGVQFTHVPFKGGPESLAALEGGHVMANADATGWTPMVEAGKARLLVLWTADRNPAFKDAPTLKELGLNFVIDSPFGIAGPKGMDPAIVQKLHDAFAKALDDPSVVDLMRKFHYPKRYMGPADYAAFVKEVVAEQKQIVEKLGLAKKD